MKLSHLDDDLAVSGQLTEEDIRAIAAQGYKTIINCRPDGEKGDYITAEQAADVAAACGLAYHHLPVAPDQLTDEAVEKFSAISSAASGPLVAHCGTGRRASVLWALGKAGTADTDEILRRCADAGHDLSPLRPRLVQHSQ